VIVVTQDADRKVGVASGVVLTRDALVATNHHVVDGAKEILIQTSSGETYSTVSVIAVDAPRDLAILFVPGLHRTSPPLADSNTIEVGEDVLAIGNPEGLAFTLSKGIVSGLRPPRDGRRSIQTTVPISLGSSGGPILNMRGEIIGLARSFLSEGQNLNFAVPSNDVRRLLNQALTDLRAAEERLARERAEEEAARLRAQEREREQRIVEAVAAKKAAEEDAAKRATEGAAASAGLTSDSLVAPVLVPGDEWTFQEDSPRGKSSFVWILQRVKVINGVAAYVIASGTSREIFFRKSDLAYMMDTVNGQVDTRSVPPESRFVWPLAAHVSWQQEATTELPLARQWSTVTQACETGDSEVVTVPAGTFTAVKVTCRNRGSGEMLTERWYAPAAKFWVKERRWFSYGIRTRELTSVRLH
jgi:hypothetical protein